MPNLFVFTAGNPEAQEHLEQSIKNPIAPETILNSFPPENHPLLREIETKASGFYAWGATPGPQNEARWSRMGVGDWVLCVYANAYRYVGQVLGKFRNAQCAKAIWGVDKDGHTWEYMYFLAKPVTLNRPVAELMDELNQGYLGFTRIGDDRVERLIQTHGSLESFIDRRVLAPTAATSAYLLLRSNIRSEWRDEEGESYHYGATVPNYTKITQGTEFLLDRKIDSGVCIIGRGRFGEVREESGPASEGRQFRATFTEYHALQPPRLVTSDLQERLLAVPGYNLQHSIRVLTKDLFQDLGRPARAWIFQANPKVYDIRRAVQELKVQDFTVNRFRSEISAGDRVYFWESGPDAAIVGAGDAMDVPTQRRMRVESRRYQRQPDAFPENDVRVDVAIRLVASPPVERRALQKIEALANLSILRAPEATNFRVTPEEAEVIEDLLSKGTNGASAANLTSLEGLRQLYRAFQAEQPNVEWQKSLASFLDWVSKAPEAERATLAFQKRLWNENEVSSVGQGNIRVDEVLADEAFRTWLAHTSMQGAPRELDRSVPYFEALYDELRQRLSPPKTSRIPHLKIFRVLAALFPRHFTVIVDREALIELHAAMFGNAGATPVARHAAALRRIEEAIGPPPADLPGLATRMTFTWYLYDRAVRTTDGPPRTSTGFDRLLASLDRAKLYFPNELVSNYLLALQTNRFVILTGLSGTGKTQLAIATARHFQPTVTRQNAVAIPDGAVSIETQPYMWKHNCMSIPATIRSQLRLPPPHPETVGGGRIAVTYPGGTTTLAFWRDPERPASVLYFKGPFREWFENLTVGSRLAIQVEDAGDPDAFSSLRFTIPESIEHEELLDNWCVTPVRPDWTDNRGLLGYYNPLTGRYIATDFLRLLLRANSEVEAAIQEERSPKPFFVILDEMNLARVEHYFSDFLSCLESAEAVELHQEEQIEEGEGNDGLRVPRKLEIPTNVFFTGTVNVDETTYMFSPKVLDRAFTVELHDVNLRRFGAANEAVAAGGGFRLDKLPSSLEPIRKPNVDNWKALGQLLDGELQDSVVQLNELLRSHSKQFGYRVASEIGGFVTLAAAQAASTSETLWIALDLAILEKVLPKFHGTQRELQYPLRALLAFAVAGLVAPGTQLQRSLEDEWEPSPEGYIQRKGTTGDRESPALPRTATKVWRMLGRLRDQGFTSFIE